MRLVEYLPLAAPAFAHMQLKWPYPLRSVFDPENDWSVKDYDMTSPLLSSGSNFPCKNYQLTTHIRSVTTWKAGSVYNITLDGSINHGGGSCQLSLSYDRGQTFTVIQSMIGGCPLQNSYDFEIPSDAPNGAALFAWTWFNLKGNREMYMNCADITIEGGSGGNGGSGNGGTFAQRPQMFVANVGNGCETTEGVETVFSQAGDRVIFNNGISESSPAYPIC